MSTVNGPQGVQGVGVMGVVGLRGATGIRGATGVMGPAGPPGVHPRSGPLLDLVGRVERLERLFDQLLKEISKS